MEENCLKAWPLRPLPGTLCPTNNVKPPGRPTMAYPSSRQAGAASLPDLLSRPLKRAIAQQVVGLFNDRARGEAPVQRRADGLFGPRAVAWRIHGDVGAMMVGGIASLMLQMLHPAVLAGVWDHSNFRQDMHGRLRRTARFIALTTYGSREDAEAVIARINKIHAHVGGWLPNGEPYSATDPALLAWVHVTEVTSFLNAWIRYAEPFMSGTDQDRYIAEMAQIGSALGANPVPRSRAEANRLITTMRPELRVDARTKEIANILINQRAPDPLVAPMQALATQAAMDLMPGWAQRMHGVETPLLARPALRAGAFGVARTLRWAFA